MVRVVLYFVSLITIMRKYNIRWDEIVRLDRPRIAKCQRTVNFWAIQQAPKPVDSQRDPNLLFCHRFKLHTRRSETDFSGAPQPRTASGEPGG